MREAGLEVLLSRVILMGLFILVFAQSPDAHGKPILPERPQSFVDTQYVKPSGENHLVQSGGDFQAALDEAEPGDVITLEAGAVFTGPFVLPRKSGDRWIVVRSGATSGELPPEGTRVNPAMSGAMPKLVSTSGPVITTRPGAHHFRFIGIEIKPGRAADSSAGRLIDSLKGTLAGNRTPGTDGVFLHNVVQLGQDESRESDLPHHIIFDRCYIHGDVVSGARRGIAMNSRHTAVINSYLSDFKEVGADSQAIAGWNGPGPFKIVNNYLEGAGENVLFGGADPSIEGLVPSDIEIRGNHFFKPLKWKKDHDEYAGTPWSVKNLFELKNARRVLVDGNLFEHNWPHAQSGFSILFTVRNQEGSAPWSVVEDVTFSNNVLRKIGSGINILGYDDNYRSRQTRRILIENNLFYDVGGTWGGGRLFQLINGTEDVVIRHNTALQSDSLVVSAKGKPHRGFVFAANIAPHNDYGIIGSDFGVGMPTIERYFPGSDIRGNVIVGGDAGAYPADNYFPLSLSEVGFKARDHGDFRLEPSSPYSQAAGGGTAGVRFDALCESVRQAASEAAAACERTARKPAARGASS